MDGKLEEHFLSQSSLISFTFDQLYLVNLCPIFVGTLQNLGDILEKNKYIGLICDQNWSFS